MVRRKIRRGADLRSFQLTLDELEVLVEKMHGLLSRDGAGLVETEILVNVDEGEIIFQTVSEMRCSDELPKRVSNFVVEMVRGDADVRLDSKHGESSPAVLVTGETPGWCAAMVEEVRAFLNRKRSWYWWFRGFPLGALVWAPAVVAVVIEKMWDVKTNGTGVFAAMVVAFALFASRDSVFPAATIQVRSEGRWARRYSAELALVTGLLGLITSIVQAFVK